MNCSDQHIKSFLDAISHEKLILACSGGIDSMVLVHLLLNSGRKFEVAHVNYQLRGEESDLDEKLVEETAQKYSIPFHLKKVNLGQQLSENGGNLQNEARKIRYQFFQSLVQNPTDKIVLAHQQDDQVESFFLNLGRGANINGLAGMKTHENQFLRPLLNISRTAILQYSTTHSVEWREDLSNTKNDYSRNKLRNVFIPELLELNSNVREQVLILISAFQETQVEIDLTIQPLLHKIKTTDELTFSDFDKLSHDELLELLRQLKLTGIFAKELNKLRNAERGKFLFVAKQQLKIVREKDCFKFVS